MYIEENRNIPVDSYGDIRTLVRGLPYQCPDDWKDVLESLDEDSNLYLVKEPDNPKDKLAIAVYLDDRRIGYVAASDNKKIWQHLTDEKIQCTFLEKFEASFKISFEYPRNQFEELPFEGFHNDNCGVTEKVRTKSIDIQYPINFRSNSINELQMIRGILDLLKEGINVTCYALYENGEIRVYLDDDSLFYSVVDIRTKVQIKRILGKEKILFGSICTDKNYGTHNHNLLIKLYYDYISGNHNDDDIALLWLRDLTAKLYQFSVPKAKYIGTKSLADRIEKNGIDLTFPCYEDDEHDYFDFSKINTIGKHFNTEIILKTEEHLKDLYHNPPYVVLARQNPALPSLYELSTLDGGMFDVLTDVLPEDIKLREWIKEEGLVPVTVQSYKKEASGLLTLNYRAFKKKETTSDVRQFVDAHFMNDAFDTELDKEVFSKIVNIIDPHKDGSMTEDLNVLACIPDWASQAAYYIVGNGEPIWLSPSYHPDILDQVHQNNGTQGRVVKYRDNFDGTYHFELKFHIEK